MTAAPKTSNETDDINSTDNMDLDEIPPEERDAMNDADTEAEFLRSLETISGTSDGALSSVSQASKKRKAAAQTETNEILREFLANRPKPSDFLPQKPADDVQQFFDSMASTVRKFTPVSIAKIKLKIANIVGEEEIVWAEEQSRFQVVFVENPSADDLDKTITDEP